MKQNENENVRTVTEKILYKLSKLPMSDGRVGVLSMYSAITMNDDLAQQ